MLQLMQVPAWLISAVESGTAVVDGAIVRELASGRVLAHLQPTSHFPQPLMELTMGGGLSPLSVVSGLVGNVQLLKVQQDMNQLKEMVHSVQMVASIGAAASVLNLGVSMAGFALVLNGLKRVESRLDSVASMLTDLSHLHHAQHVGRCLRALQQAQEAYSLRLESERLRYWREADSTLAELIQVGGQLIAKQGLPLNGPHAERLGPHGRLQALAQPAVIDSLRWLMAFSAARTEVLLCLGEPGLAAEVSADAARWLEPLPHEPLPLALAATRGEPLPPSQLKVAAQLAKATAVLVKAGRDAALAKSSLARQLNEAGTDTAESMLRLQCSQDRLLVWAPELPR